MVCLRVCHAGPHRPAGRIKSSTLQDREISKFVESPTRPSEPSVETVNAADALCARIDEVGTTTYIGTAAAGALEASGVWRIKKMLEVGNDITITFADGNANFDNIWSNRLSLTYS